MLPNYFKLFLILFIKLVIMSSCIHNSNSKSSEVIYTNLHIDKERKEPIPLSKIFPKYKLIDLETNDDCLIGGMNNKVIKYDSLFYIRSVNEIMVFDNEGKFLKKLSACGAGPEEYNLISDFTIPDDRNEIWVSTNGGIKKYDLNDFSFIGVIPLDYHVHTFRYLGNDLIAVSTNDDDALYKLINTSGETIREFFENDRVNIGAPIVDFYLSTSNQKLIHPLAWSNDIVYLDLNSKEFGISKLIDADNSFLNTEVNLEIAKSMDLFERSQYIQDHFVQILCSCEIGNAVLMILHYPGNKWKLLISKGNDSVVIPYFPEEDNMIIYDIFDNTEPRTLSTLCCSDSNDSFLFLVNRKDAENNPYVLEVTEVAIP